MRYVLSTEAALRNCITEIRDAGLDGDTEVIVRDIKKAKTLAQLGGLFGCWVKHIAEEEGESEKYIHRKLKAGFLARIYAMAPLTPEQEQWVELLATYQQAGPRDKFERHCKRISLSWATTDQMREYMNAIERHYIAEGRPLPILDKFRSAYSS